MVIGFNVRDCSGIPTASDAREEMQRKARPQRELGARPDKKPPDTARETPLIREQLSKSRQVRVRIGSDSTQISRAWSLPMG